MKFLVFFFAFCLVSCSKTPPASQKPTILVSIAPYQSLTERIAGETFFVQTVVPPGANPHAYEPNARQIRAIEQGVVWFRIGESFENKILPVLKEKNPNLVDADLRKGVCLLQGSCCHEHEMEDRHIWLSPQALAIQVQTIATVLSGKFPEHRETFVKNANRLTQELALLDLEIQEILKPVQHRTFLVSHSAFAYFCKDYDLSQISIEWRGKEPTAKYLTGITQKLTNEEARLAIAMPQHSNKGLELIADKLHMRVQTIDPYASHSFETMRHLAHLVAEHE